MGSAPALNKRPALAAAAVPDTHAGSRAAKDNPPRKAEAASLYRLPKSILARLPIALRFDERGFDASSLSAYGVSCECYPPMKAAIDDAAKQIKELEIAHSQLVNPEGGDQYFRIRCFPEEGAAVREKLLAAIRFLLTEFDDDRAELLESALARHWEFRSFGLEKTEVYIEEVTRPDGQSAWQAKERVTSGNIRDERTATDPASKARLARLIEKHVPRFAADAAANLSK
jgi:hypothetical protein